MNGNTLFQNPPQPSQTPTVSSQSQESAPQGNSIGQNQVLESGSSEQPPSFVFHASRSPISLRNVVKILLGLIVVVVIGLFIFKIVIPNIQNTQDSKATLEYWGLWEDASVMNSIISDFNRQYPDIKINYSKQDIKQYRERLTARIQNGTGPDIFRFHNTWVQMLSDTLLPLPNDVIKRDDFTKLFYPVAQKDLIKDGAIYGIPIGIDTLALYINTNIFKSAGISAPDNWVDFINFARSLTVVDENGKIRTAGAALGTFNNITHASDIISLLFVQSGVDLNNITQNKQAAVEALTFYTSFALSSGSKTWDRDLDSSILAFGKGNLAMYFGYSWDFFTIKAINPDLVFEIYPVPHLPNQNTTIASYWPEGVSIKSKHQKEAFLFMKFLAKKETEERLFAESTKTRLFGEPYANRELADTLSSNAIVYPFVSQANDAESSFFASETFDNGLNFQMNTYLEDAVNSILGSTSPQTAVETLSQGVNQVLQQYSAKSAK